MKPRVRYGTSDPDSTHQLVLTESVKSEDTSSPPSHKPNTRSSHLNHPESEHSNPSAPEKQQWRVAELVCESMPQKQPSCQSMPVAQRLSHSTQAVNPPIF